MAHLEATNGTQSGVEFDVERPRTRIGRHPDCELLVDSGGSVSRFHAEITRQDGVFYVADSQSRNGTYVNGRLADGKERLFDQDRIQICDLVFVFVDDRLDAKRSGQDSAFPITAVLVEDTDPAPSSIMSRLEVSTSGRHLHLQSSADAKLRAMMELTDSLAHSLSVDEVLSPVLDSLFKIFLQADQGFIVLQTDKGVWQPRCTHFRRESNENVRISRSIVNHVMEKREAILSADAADDSRFDLSESIASFRIRSFMCVPLIDTEGHVVGAVQIDSIDSQTQFEEKDLELAVSVATQAAIAIQRASLHDQAIRTQAVEAELDLARQVQLSLLPVDRPTIDGYEFFDYYRAANKIGGDYFDYVALPDGRLAAIVADVSGHGIAAAMVMTKLAAEARFCLATISQPGEVVARLNNLLCANGVEDRFVTMVMLVLNPNSHELTVVNAGHSSPVVRNSEGNVESLPHDHAGLILGVMEDASYEPLVYQLQPGDAVTIFTDGIIEAMDPDGSQYGDDRLKERITKDGNEGVESLGRHVIDDVAEFVGDGVQTDDVCLVCLKRLE